MRHSPLEFPNKVSAVLVEMCEQLTESSSKYLRFEESMFGYLRLAAHRSHILKHGFEPRQGDMQLLIIGIGFISSIAFSFVVLSFMAVPT